MRMNFKVFKIEIKNLLFNVNIENGRVANSSENNIEERKVLLYCFHFRFSDEVLIHISIEIGTRFVCEYNNAHIKL